MFQLVAASIRTTVYFCVLTLYPVIMLNSPINSSFKIDTLGFLHKEYVASK